MSINEYHTEEDMQHTPFRTTATLASTLLLAIGTASAQEFTLQNDSIVIGGPGVIQLGFVNGEVGCATFFPDPSLFPLQIKRVQIGWGAQSSGAQNNIQDSILVYEGAPSASNTPIFVSNPPQLTPQFLNEFDFESETIVIVDPGPITVGLRFSDAPNGNFTSASLITDLDGCQNGKNYIYAIPGGWFPSCLLGVTGDFNIRAVVETVDIPCYPDCDESGSLNILDYICYGDAFTTAQIYADCDGNGSLNILDYICYGDAFTAGCP